MSDYLGERCPHCGVEYCACWMCLPGSQYHHRCPRLVPIPALTVTMTSLYIEAAIEQDRVNDWVEHQRGRKPL